MDNYIGTKKISAAQMSRAEYNKYRNWDLPADENGEDEGYLVEYAGDSSNHPQHNGYISWSPKEQFEKSYVLEKGHLSKHEFEAPHQQRVVEEAKELAEKSIKLNDFIENNSFFKTLEPKEQIRMKLQLATMECYHSILIERIENF